MYHTWRLLLCPREFHQRWVNLWAGSRLYCSPRDCQYSQIHIIHLPDGSYCARFPWKENIYPPLPTNSNICKKRIRSFANWLSQTSGLLQMYNNIINAQLNKDFIERVYTPEQPGLTHFIPHHYAKKNCVTTPIRIVYDCSCHQSKDHPSLNNCLLTWPSLSEWFMLHHPFPYT